jgi:hypothetical protein
MPNWCENKMRIYAKAKTVRNFIAECIRPIEREPSRADLYIYDPAVTTDISVDRISRAASRFDNNINNELMCIDLVSMLKIDREEFEHNFSSDDYSSLLGCDGRMWDFTFSVYPEDEDNEFIEYDVSYMTAWAPARKFCAIIAYRYQCAVSVHYSEPMMGVLGIFACHYDNPQGMKPAMKTSETNEILALFRNTELDQYSDYIAVDVDEPLPIIPDYARMDLPG